MIPKGTLYPFHAQRFELVLKATERASTIVTNRSVSLGCALDAACRNLGIVLDDDSYAMAIVSLGKYRLRLEGSRHVNATHT